MRAPIFRQRVLRTITEAPSVTIAQIRDRLPEVSRSRIANAITELLESGAIQRVRRGHYRVKERRHSVDNHESARGQPLRLLMAGR